MRHWIELPAISFDEALLELVGRHRLAAEALARRGFTEVKTARAFLDPAHYIPSPPEAFPGMEQAVERLALAIHRREHILVWGDFDVDGQTATALLVSMLRELGGRVSYHIPVRAQESHGVGLPVLKSLLTGSDAPGLLLTCDTGISAHEAVAYARGKKVDVIITDHHELPTRTIAEDEHLSEKLDSSGERVVLPQANAILSPHFLEPGHPLSGLPGVGVAYKLAEAVLHRFDRPGQSESYLDLAALGIVADVAQHTPDVRYLLQRGIAALRQPRRIGLQAIYERADLKPENLTEEHIGFVLAPRLNALGRLADANQAVELLTTSDLDRARLLALELEGLNIRRQLLTSQVLQGALTQIEREPSLLQEAALVLVHPNWPAGVIGIVASRLVELFGRPAILISAPTDEAGRGSARSIAGVDITAAIATQAHHLHSFGGHAMAAGFAMDMANFPAFRRGLLEAVANQMVELSEQPDILRIDGYLDWGALSLELAETLEKLAPFGPGNPPLVIASHGLVLTHQAAFGKQGEHLQLICEDENGQSNRVVWWGGGEMARFGKLPQGAFDLAYSIRATGYRGQQTLSISLIDFREAPAAGEISAEISRLEIQDFRDQAHPLPILELLMAGATGEEIQIWAEAEAFSRLKERFGDVVRRRDELSACRCLAIWTTPPGRTELEQALNRCQPSQIVLFGIEPETDDLQGFLKRLTGLVKHAISNQGGETTIEQLAAATAQGSLAVQFGLEWLEASGYIQIRLLQADSNAPEEARLVRIFQTKSSPAPEQATAIQKVLKNVLDEVRAYRAYFKRGDPLNGCFPSKL